MRNFIAVLTDFGEFVDINTLPRHLHAKMRDANWPSHDQHLLAAAVDGMDPTVYVTESRHVRSAKAVRRHFGIRIVEV
jgi:hypothetical protein